MDKMKASLIVIAAALLVFGLGGVAYAFHSGGVAECGGCHSMHSPNPAGTFLLKGQDASSTCLGCHQNADDTGPSSYHISTADASLGTGQAPLQRTPGGDFGWIKKTYSWTLNNATETEEGATHGHNIVAADFGYLPDGTGTSPGGSYPAANLGCNSCHDPHGKSRRLNTGVIATTGAPIKTSGSYYNGKAVADNEPTATEAVGVYRLLGGSGYSNTASGVIGFPGVPAAKVPSTYNRSEGLTQTRTAYMTAPTGTGHTTWGNWCGTCHGAMHSSGNYVHPVDQNLSGGVITNYIQYKKSGDMSGVIGSSFLSLVPFAQGNVYATVAPLAVNNDTQLGGPASGAQVMCLSCHRAHASGWEYGLRWNMEYEFITVNGDYVGSDNASITGTRAGAQHRGRTIAEAKAAYYDRPATVFATYQRVLCNKCHAKD